MKKTMRPNVDVKLSKIGVTGSDLLDELVEVAIGDRRDGNADAVELPFTK